MNTTSSSSLSTLFFSNLPSSISLDEDIKEYIENIISDIEDLVSLRDATEQFLVDAGMSEEELEGFYPKLSIGEKRDGPDASIKDPIVRLPPEVLTKPTTPKSGGNTSNKSREKISRSPKTNSTSTAHATNAPSSSSSSSPISAKNEVFAYSQQSRFHTDTLETLSKEIDLKGVNITVGHQELLVDSRLQLKTGVHYGLIGRNGVGKSTLLRCMGTRELIGFPKNVRVLYIEQLDHVDESLRVIDLVLQADEERTILLQEKQVLQQAAESNGMEVEDAVKKVKFERLKKEMEEAQKIAIHRSGRRGLEARQELVDAEARVLEAQRALDEKHEDPNEDYTAKLHELLDDVYTRLDQIGADSAEPRAREILSGLGFSEKQQYSPIASLSSLSGGWRMRVALAQALFLQPDVLLLDEPTNHLDLPAILWLQSYLNTLIDTTIVIVSHDRRFLNKTVTEIIRFKDQKLTYYTGNYDEFEKNLEDQRLKKERMYEAQEKQKKHIESSIQKGIKKAKESGDDKKLEVMASKKKKLERFGMNKTEDGFRFKLNKHMVGYYNTIREQVTLETSEPPINWNIPSPPPLRHHGPLLQLDSVSFTYPNSSRQILHNVSLSISSNSRIGFVGANGDGKSTLLGLLAGTLESTKGMVNRHPQMKLGYFSQNQINSLNLEISAIEYMKQYFSGKSSSNINDQTARQHLGKFGISGDLVLKKLEYLSGGQKSRVAFALQVFPTSPNLLILDEITNHLDMATIEAMAKVLEEFDGAVVVVSHDRWFVENVTNEVYVVKRGDVKLLEGGVEEYTAKVAKQIGVDVDEV